tara:strand:+ start:4619 stop:4939 length:321 start_codon:yes stop_codon:yes gene_type:complete
MFWNNRRKKRKDVASSRRGGGGGGGLFGLLILLVIFFLCYYLLYMFINWVSGGSEADRTIKELQAKMDAGEVLNNNEMIRYQNAKMTNMGIQNTFLHAALQGRRRD